MHYKKQLVVGLIFFGLAFLACGTYFMHCHIESRRRIEVQTIPLNSENNQKIKWTDSILESGIRNIINKKDGDIYMSDLWYCVAFQLGRGIEYNDKSIKFTGEPITDISSLEGLENLKSLQMNYNEITDISVLSSMRNIQYLQLDGNPIQEISPIETQQMLFFLNLRNMHLQGKDLEHVSGLENLRMLFLDFNDIENLEALKNVKLIHLSLQDNQISDLTPLSNLDNDLLNILQLSDNRITNIEPLSRLDKLADLYLDNNKIEILPDFSEMTSLQTLHLANNQITTEEWNKIKLPWSIRTVDISGNPITDLETEQKYYDLEVIFNEK